MAEIEVVGTGLIYRNPKPHLRSRQAFFPSLALLPGGDLLAAFGLGSAFESVDAHTVLARSRDEGQTWAPPGTIGEGSASGPASSNVRIGLMPDGELVAAGARWDRTRTEEGLTNPATLGFVPTELILLRSRDDGRSWEGPRVIDPPLVGPSFEVCSPIVPLRDGRWLWPTSTWRGWDGACPHGMKAIALVSGDRGRTWPGYLDVMDGTAEEVVYWEQKLIELDDGRLLAVCWTHDLGHGEDREVHHAVSTDGGRHFSPPRPTGLHGQTTTPLDLGGGRILCVYRRSDRPGLWASRCRLSGDRWEQEAEAPLWGTSDRPETEAPGRSIVEAMSALRFGLPASLRLPGGDVLTAFWGVEDCMSVIRWFRLRTLRA
ncbi:MAG TPA: sialidase family protein [Thermomicrobiaceae bacterium]|nr:sialidase family protein [Thermomicrobiaceae bacterium]